MLSDPKCGLFMWHLSGSRPSDGHYGTTRRRG